MKIVAHGPHLRQITFGAPILPMNCYLVKETDGFTLVDTVLGLTAHRLIGAIEEFGLPLRRIVLTHAHGDHAGGLEKVRKAFPEAEVMVSEREARLMAGDRAGLPGEPVPSVRGLFVRAQTPPHRLLRPGDRVASLTVHDAAGHSPGQIALLDERDRTLIAGDAFFTVGGLHACTEFYPLFPWPSWATWHRPTAHATAARLSALGAARLVVGHGDAIQNLTETPSAV